MKKLVGIVTLALFVALCTPASAQEGHLHATVELKDAQGQSVGTVMLMQEGNGIHFKGQFMNMPAGPHGIHVHAVGTCTPDFAAAGPHYNPAGKQHGLENPAGAHAGDLPNIEISADGKGSLDHKNMMLTMTPGPMSVYDADGSAIIVHANADDYKTDPSGNSGGRIACGVVPAAEMRGAQPAPAPQQPGQAAEMSFSATLSGQQEVPNPGDPDGTGTSMIKMRANNEVCWEINVANITLPAAAAHIHEGAPGVAGPVVVPLSAPDANGRSNGCANAEAALADRIRQNPGGFYVNVHTSDFPGGAVRGQLAMGATPQPAPQPAPQQPAPAPQQPAPAPQPPTGPAQLPNTGGESVPLLALLLIALGIMVGGADVVRRARS